MEASDAVWPDDAIEVGRIVGAWGVKGWVRVQAFSPDPQALFSSRQWLLARPLAGEAGARPPATLQRVKLREVREHGDGIVAFFHDVDDRSGAEALKGMMVVVSRKSFPTPDADEYYWVDLVGCAVVNRQGDRLGTVVELFATGPTSVMRVRDEALMVAGSGPEAQAETLVPFVAAYVDSVSLAERRILVDWERGD